MTELRDAFRDFRRSPEASKPAFEVRTDWRAEQLRQARLNGDIAADENPDTSVSNGYWDSSAEEEEDGSYELNENGESRPSW